MAKIKTSAGDKWFDAVNLTLLGLVSAVVLYPLLFVLSASFSNPAALFEGKVWLFPVGFNVQSYTRVLQDPNIVTGYLNTLLYTTVGTTLNIALTICAAYPLSRKDFDGRNTLMMLFTFTMFFSGGLIPTYLLIKNLGMINTIWAIILPNAVSMWNIIIMRTFFQTIPSELHESAQIDGSSNIRTLLRIVLPLSMPVIAVMILFYGVSHWNAFFNALIYLSDHSKFPLQLIIRQILLQNQMGEMVEATESSVDQILIAEGIKYAVIVVSSLPVLVLYPFLQRYFVKGVMIGAIKG
ncbi:carbohydrate ABC transporter permease [Paenibacillus sp. J5C_2022]|uniref:carbohydrate ABC transporter permease n=1 Tax=Paenibacillus sp. J5C2022 TaxID=2977129 RepID=UPI0021D3485E|nr:carbohydrate ABC transporter permease [Paenibacillus sp. J5C2022]MCU6709951.1 carbohydrate ABC transporter permease [Paenibacillus sp. J5C2022]